MAVRSSTNDDSLKDFQKQIEKIKKESGTQKKPTNNPRRVAILVLLSLIGIIILICGITALIDTLKNQTNPFPGPGMLVLANWNPASDEWRVFTLKAGTGELQPSFSFPYENDRDLIDKHYGLEPVIVSPTRDMMVFPPGILVNLETRSYYDYLGITYGRLLDNQFLAIPAFSPDGNRLAYWSSDQIYILKLKSDTTEAPKLVYDPLCAHYGDDEEYELCVSTARPTWLDNETLLFTHSTLPHVIYISTGGVTNKDYQTDTLAVVNLSGDLLHEYQYRDASLTSTTDSLPVLMPLGRFDTPGGAMIQVEIDPVDSMSYLKWFHVEDLIQGKFVPENPGVTTPDTSVDEIMPDRIESTKNCVLSPGSDGAMACIVIEHYSSGGFDRVASSLAIVNRSGSSIQMVLRWEEEEWYDWHLVTWLP